jgi:collagenase-like PrtC family protease
VYSKFFFECGQYDIIIPLERCGVKKNMRKEYFRILAPFGHIEEVKLLKKAGADELYCGYVTEELMKKWPLAFHIINRRGEGQSFENYETFRNAVEESNRYELPVYVTINGLYTPEQYPLLLTLAKKVECLQGVEGVIIADLGLLLALKKHRFSKEIHISTGGTCFNSNTADFYQSLGAKRIILDRQLTAYEIEKLITGIKSKIDIEIFIINEGCGGFIDGFCTFFHCSEKQPTGEERIRKDVFLHPSYNTEQVTKGCVFYFGEMAKGNFKMFSTTSYKEKRNNLRFQSRKDHLVGCRICDLYDLKNYPIKSLKIVGRGVDSKYTAKSVRIVSKMVSYSARNVVSKKEYRHKCKDLFSKIVLKNEHPCTKFHCYFSSHWVKNENKT